MSRKSLALFPYLNYNLITVNKKNIRSNKNGFTLVELLIVVAIIGILAMIAVPVYIGQQKKAAMTEAISNLQQLRLLEEQFFAENARYAPPAPGTALTFLDTAFFNVATDVVPIPANSIRTSLPGFRPGNARDLNYDYVIFRPAQILNTGTCNSAGNDPNAPAGGSFTACAMPKADRIVRNSAPFWINDRNQNNF